MERLVLIGVSHRRGGAAALEAWQGHLKTLTLQELQQKGFPEIVVLQTCNRCDILVSLRDRMSVSEAKAKLAPPDWPRCYAYVGEGAVEQLTRIAASLDSLNPGEFQIMTQVREAFAAAEKAKTVGKDIRFACTTAFRIAKRIRHEIEFAPINTSLFSLARPEMEKQLPQRARIGIIGTGTMGRLVARVLQERPETTIVLINRNVERAHTLVQEESIDADVLSLAQYLEELPPLDGIVCATPVAQLLHAEIVQKLQSTRVIVDLGIPRNVDGASAEEFGITVLDVDTLQKAGAERRKKIEHNLAQAEELLLDALDEAIGEWIERQLSQPIQQLRERYVDTVATFSIDAKDHNRIASRMAHIPIKGLRALAREHGLKAAQTFLKGANIEHHS